MQQAVSLSLDEIERANRRTINSDASNIDLLEYGLRDPLADIDRFTELMPGNRMLDVGCGWARYVPYFVEAGFDYLGVDLSPVMLTTAVERNPGLAFANMSFRSLAFPDKTFDGLWCCCAIEYEPKHNLPAVLREMRRVLTPGGIIYIVTHHCMESHESLRTRQDGERLYSSYYYPEELERMVQRAGFGESMIIERPLNGAFSLHAIK